MCIRGNKSNKELSLVDLQNLHSISEFADHDIVITGGEPTLCKDFVSIVNFLKGKCKSISICTNGTTDFYINKEFFDFQVNIQISIDGTEDVHNTIRGKQSYSRIMHTISKLEEIDIPYAVSSVVNKNNRTCMKELADILGNLESLRCWNISYEMPFGHAVINEIMTAEEWNNFVDDMLDYVNFRMKIQKMFPFELYDKNKAKLEEIFKGRRCSNCGSGQNKIYVYPDLFVYPCTCLTDFRLGNLKDSSLSQIMQTKLALSFANYSLLPESKCQKCEYLKYCNGGCIGMSYHFFKKIGLGDIRCPKLRDKI
ncbi:MAG: radical SAM protein [Muribaculaceae bacterium]|nr:radical SAM protein [Muribaculaceae bacterium]